MEYLLYFYLVLIILCWTLNPFFKKKMLNKLNNDEYFVINHILITTMMAFYFFYLFKKKKCSPNCLKTLNRYDYLYIFLGSVTSILGARLMITLIKYKEISYLIAHIQPIVIALTFIIGYIFFSENLSLYKIIGISLIILGLIIINKKNI
jgi:uncharacterized membrane protein